MAGGVAAGLLAMLVGLSVVAAAEEEEAGAPVGLVTTLDSRSVPPEYVAWVERAGHECAEVSAPLIAAQIDAESGWNATARSHAGAQGLS
ncbi:hypothetical protein AN220_25030, partial [Streptomyces nanshensis]